MHPFASISRRSWGIGMLQSYLVCTGNWIKGDYIQRWYYCSDSSTRERKKKKKEEFIISCHYLLSMWVSVTILFYYLYYFYAISIIYFSSFLWTYFKLNDKTQLTCTILIIDPHGHTCPYINNTFFFYTWGEERRS